MTCPAWRNGRRSREHEAGVHRRPCCRARRHRAARSLGRIALGAALCRVLSVSTSWFYSWRAAAPKRAARRASQDALLPRIRAIFEASGRRYGAPRIHAELRGQGIRVARKTVAKLMQDHDIRPPRKGRRVPQTTDSRHNFGIAPNLLRRNFRAAKPDRMWLADISYVSTDEGWLYLAAIKE